MSLHASPISETEDRYASAAIGFYSSVPAFARFEEITDTARYLPLPDDWVLGLADVVGSTAAIAAGGYKSVNMAGASAIAAVANAIRTHEFPFVFGGDGASFAIPAEQADVARAALAATVVYAREELDIALRAAMVPVAAVRQAGLDVRLARFAPSPDVSYAMFSGGGLAWAEREMKRGAFALEPARPGSRPDLTGLSCRFEEVPASRGTVLSLLVAPTWKAGAEYWELLQALLARLADPRAAGRPVSTQSLRVKWPPTGLELEARSRRRPGVPRWLYRFDVGIRTLLSCLIFRFRIKVGRFSPVTYYRELVENSDFRKYDDALRMTIDCTERLADEIGELLEDAARRGIARYGMHLQSGALVTCLTPTMYGSHFHFIDGAAGGYAKAALSLKGG
jgi:hypothetical protein